MTQVENTLRRQKQIWREVAEATVRASATELPNESPKRLVLLGVGSSYFAAQITAGILRNAGYRGNLPIIALQSTAVGREYQPAKGDWVLAFSHRGKTKVTLDALSRCHFAGAFCILACSRDVKHESEDLPWYSTLATGPLETVEPHTQAVTSAVCAATILFLGPSARQEWNALSDSPEPDLDDLKKRVGKGPQVVLGEWDAELLAHEAALKLMEMALLPVRSYGTESFFHGPRQSLKSEAGIWYIQAEKDLRAPAVGPEGNLQLLLHLGGKGISPVISTLVQLQWASLAVALSVGNNPDEVPKKT